MNARRFTSSFRLACLILLLAAVYVGVSSDLGHASTPVKTAADIPAGKPDAMIDLGSVEGATRSKDNGATAIRRSSKLDSARLDQTNSQRAP
jgi:hypothetical protein